MSEDNTFLKGVLVIKDSEPCEGRWPVLIAVTSPRLAYKQKSPMFDDLMTQGPFLNMLERGYDPDATPFALSFQLRAKEPVITGLSCSLKEDEFWPEVVKKEGNWGREARNYIRDFHALNQSFISEERSDFEDYVRSTARFVYEHATEDSQKTGLVKRIAYFDMQMRLHGHDAYSKEVGLDLIDIAVTQKMLEYGQRPTTKVSAKDLRNVLEEITDKTAKFMGAVQQGKAIEASDLIGEVEKMKDWVNER